VIRTVRDSPARGVTQRRLTDPPECVDEPASPPERRPESAHADSGRAEPWRQPLRRCGAVSSSSQPT